MNKVPARAWQRMLSGRRLDIVNPSPLDIEISDIAHGLSRIARWNGQTIGENIFSVAQHSILVLYIFNLLYPKATAEQKLLTLLHDAPEYVIADMVSPFKKLMGKQYKETEKKLEDAIYQRFSINTHMNDTMKKRIKKADLASAYYEATQLAGFTEREALKYVGKPIDNEVIPSFYLENKSSQIIQKEFLDCFEELNNNLK